jgi:hypothetical protein
VQTVQELLITAHHALLHIFEITLVTLFVPIVFTAWETMNAYSAVKTALHVSITLIFVSAVPMG